MMKKALLLVGICIAAILVVLGVIAVFSSFGAYGELKTAKKLIFSAKASLEKQDIQSAAASFTKAQDHINKADSRLKAHKISIGFLKTIPYAGTQIRAVERFVRVGTHLCKAGMLLTGAARGVPGIDAASPQDNASIGTMVDLLTKLGNDLAPVEQELLSAQHESRAMKTGWLIGSASRMKRELDQKLDATLGGMKEARKLMAALPSIMGAEGAPPKNYMVLQQDCFELRASGGLISTYGILQCSRDSLKLADYQRSSTLSVGLADGDGTPPLPSLGGYPTLRFWDAGWWPDFPETTDVLSKIWSNNGKAPVDGYIAVDPIAIEYVLERIGPLELPEFGETVTARNLTKLILHYYGVDQNVAFLKSLASHFFEKVTTSSPGQWVSLGRAFARALAEKHMLLYFGDPAVQQSFSELDWSGEVKQSDGDYLMAVDSNIGGNTDDYKLNMWVKPKMNVEVTKQKDSTLRHHVTYTFDNRLGSQEYPLAYKSYLRLYVPEGAVAAADPDLVDCGSDSGKHVFAKLVDVPTGKVVTVEFEYVTPGFGSMLIQKQPGQVSLDVNLSFRENGSIKKKQKVKLSSKARLNF
jgi:hypothetical protein